MRRLQTELPAPGLTLKNILEVEPDRLNELIWAVGFHNNKTRYIKAVAPILRDEYHGDIPETIEGLISLPGVGPKMAYLCMSAAWGRDEGIGVDVHVRISCPDILTQSATLKDVRFIESRIYGGGIRLENPKRLGQYLNRGYRKTGGMKSITCLSVLARRFASQSEGIVQSARSRKRDFVQVRSSTGRP